MQPETSKERRLRLLANLRVITLTAVLLFVSIAGFEYLAAEMPLNVPLLIVAALVGVTYIIFTVKARNLRSQ